MPQNRDYGLRPLVESIPPEIRSALSILLVGFGCFAISSYFLAAALMYPRSTGYRDAQCILGDGFPSTHQLPCKKNNCYRFCCDVKVSVIPKKNTTDESFESVMQRRNCMHFPSSNSVFASTTTEIDRIRSTRCPEYLHILEKLSSIFLSNGTLQSLSFPCKYNPEKKLIPGDICMLDSFFCDIVTTFEYEELQEYDKRQAVFSPLFVFLIILGIVIMLPGLIMLKIHTGRLRRVDSTTKPPPPSNSQGFSQFDKDTNENSGSAAA